MRKLIILSLTNLLLVIQGTFVYGQKAHYSYKRELKGVSDQWHRIVLPDDVFGKISVDFTDIRIFGIKPNQDTIEVPYLLRVANEQIISKDIPFKVTNTSHNANGYYFTFEVPANELINQVNLSFNQENFDWRIKLEGSQDQKDWFTILEDYRILSIRNEETDYQFTKLVFPESKYHYLRLAMDSSVKPELSSARLERQEVSKGRFQSFTIRKMEVRESKETKQTEVEITLPMPVPVSYVKIGVAESFDYYRMLTVKYLADSIRTEKGWRYNYITATSGTLNSVEPNEFVFKSITTQKLKVLIDNQDNEPLTIDTFQVMGPEHELMARFTESADFYLVYGNNNAVRPNYDIERFASRIPSTIKEVTLGEETIQEKAKESGVEPLFMNKVWLWVVMGIIMVVIGGFSFKMMRSS